MLDVFFFAFERNVKRVISSCRIALLFPDSPSCPCLAHAKIRRHVHACIHLVCVGNGVAEACAPSPPTLEHASSPPSGMISPCQVRLRGHIDTIHRGDLVAYFQLAAGVGWRACGDCDNVQSTDLCLCWVEANFKRTGRGNGI